MKTIAVINPYCNRMVYFAVDNDYTSKGKSIEQIYDDSYMASFDKIEVSRYAIRHNLNKKKPYIVPEMQVTKAQLEEDIMCVSSDNDHNGKPGHGWGDKNHDHDGPPGQNKKHGITDIWEDF